MDAELAAFLAGHTPQVTEHVAWTPRMRLLATAYLSREAPPLPYITSVRAVVFHNGSVLVQQDQHSRHIVPGGRRQAGETLEATLRREMAEETGWSLSRLALLGFTHFHHLDAQPPDYRYPHPDFCWLVYAAEAAAYLPATKLDDGYEIGTEFMPVTEVHTLALTKNERILLDAALSMEWGSGL